MITYQTIQLRRPINETLKGKVEAHAFMVGVLEDKKRKKPIEGGAALGYLSGGPTRRTKGSTKITNTEVSKKLRSFLGFNYFVKPFGRKNDDAVKMLAVFFDICFSENASSKYRRLENLIQAVVRNPLARRDYGNNSPAWIEIKTFDRIGIDTGQLFKSIKAKVLRQ